MLRNCENVYGCGLSGDPRKSGQNPTDINAFRTKNVNYLRVISLVMANALITPLETVMESRANPLVLLKKHPGVTE